MRCANPPTPLSTNKNKDKTNFVVTVTAHFFKQDSLAKSAALLSFFWGGDDGEHSRVELSGRGAAACLADKMTEKSACGRAKWSVAIA